MVGEISLITLCGLLCAAYFIDVIRYILKTRPPSGQVPVEARCVIPKYK